MDLHRLHQPGLFHTDTKCRIDSSNNSLLNRQVRAWRTSSRPPTPSRTGTYSTSWSCYFCVVDVSFLLYCCIIAALTLFYSSYYSRPVVFSLKIPRSFFDETKKGVGKCRKTGPRNFESVKILQKNYPKFSETYVHFWSPLFGPKRRDWFKRRRCQRTEQLRGWSLSVL